jgi:hypothetical protein
MSEQKFKQGDIVKHRTTGDKAVVIEYKINHAGSVLNAFSRGTEKQFQDSVVTQEVLCEGKIDGKFQRKYIHEASLELVSE